MAREVKSSGIEQSLALAKMQFTENLENEAETAEKYVAAAVDIIFLIIRMLL